MERNDMEPKETPIETNTKKSMFSVVEQMNSVYDKYFEPKTSNADSEWYSNFKPCGSSSKDIPERSAEKKDQENDSENSLLPGSDNKQDVIKEFIRPAEVCKKLVYIPGTGCSKYSCAKK